MHDCDDTLPFKWLHNQGCPNEKAQISHGSINTLINLMAQQNMYDIPTPEKQYPTPYVDTASSALFT